MTKMKTKTCVICKEVFLPNIHNQMVCSKMCFKQRTRIYRRQYHILTHLAEFKYKRFKQNLLKSGFIICSICKNKRPLSDFYFRKSENRFRADCKECLKKKQLYRYNVKKKEILDKCKEYYQRNKEKINKRIYKKAKKNLNFRLLRGLRCRIWKILKGINKSSSTLKLLDCSIVFLRNYLEIKFKRGMSWKNYGKWHIDHIRPCASFDLSKPSEQRKCFHYTNLQPLWAEENLKKGDTYDNR